MASDYHPIYSTLWGDEKLEGAPFEERGFFAHLCSNNRVRPSGIFRVTDAQLAADTTLVPAKVRTYCSDLDKRGLIVRDGAWLFVRSYFKRQPKGENLLKGVASDIATCSSIRVLESFSLKYPIRSQWVTDRLATLDRPINDSCSTEQCSAVAVQSSAEHVHVSGGQASPDASVLPSENRNGLDHGPAAMRTAARELLAFLNKKAERHYQPVESNLGMITALLSTGTTVDQIYGVIANRVRKWKGDAKMDEFLRPSTLFRPSNFQQYLGELPATVFKGTPDA